MTHNPESSDHASQEVNDEAFTIPLVKRDVADTPLSIEPIDLFYRYVRRFHDVLSAAARQHEGDDKTALVVASTHAHHVLIAMDHFSESIGDISEKKLVNLR